MNVAKQLRVVFLHVLFCHLFVLVLPLFKQFKKVFTQSDRLSQIIDIRAKFLTHELLNKPYLVARVLR